MKHDFREEYHFPSIEYVNGSKENTYRAKAMILCFEQLTKAVHNLSIQAERIAEILSHEEPKNYS